MQQKNQFSAERDLSIETCSVSIACCRTSAYPCAPLVSAAHLQKLMSDKKCTAEKKAEMEDVITQVSGSPDFNSSF